MTRKLSAPERRPRRHANTLASSHSRPSGRLGAASPSATSPCDSRTSSMSSWIEKQVGLGPRGPQCVPACISQLARLLRSLVENEARSLDPLLVQRSRKESEKVIGLLFLGQGLDGGRSNRPIGRVVCCYRTPPLGVSTSPSFCDALAAPL